VRPWRRGASEDDPRERLLERLRPHVSDERVLAALGSVARDRFVPASLAEEAWDNVALPIGSGQTISQPLVVARMCELLALRGGERVLDVGTGSGYHAAVLAQLAEHVWSIERHAELSALAAETLAAAGVENVTLVVGDGTGGHPEAAPYDAINVAAAMGVVPRALSDQLADGGRLVGPVNTDDQRLVLLRRGSEGLERSDHERVRFVPLVSDNPQPS
jgi:protein-L-isoaspartate(D-aspartate) O-methyltransferase